jgi:hypothetical protein
MPEQENTTIESAVIDAPNVDSSVEATPVAIPDSVNLSTDLSGFERISGMELGGDKKAETPVKIEAKPEDKTEDKVEDKQVSEVKPTEPKPPVKAVDTRDFTGLTKEEIEVGKRMSANSFTSYRNLVVENKKLKEEHSAKDEKIKQLSEGKEILPPNYYDNPDAVIFSPNYRSAAKGVELANVVVNHWEQQLMRIEEGLANPEAKQTWVDLENDPKTGELRLGGERQVTLRDKVQVLRYLAQAEQQVGEYKGRLNNIVTNFKGENEKITSKIKSAEKEFFPAYETPDDSTKKTMDNARTAIRNAGISDNNPSFSPLVKSITLNMQMVDFIKSKDKKIEELEKKLGIKVSIGQDKVKAGPSSGSLSSGSTNGADHSSVPSWEEFRNRLSP